MNARYVTLLVLLLVGGCLAPHYGVDATDAPSENAGSSHGGSQASGGTTTSAGQPDVAGTESGGTNSSPVGGQGGDAEGGAPATETCGATQKKCGGKCVDISDVAYGCSPISCNQSVCPADPQAILGCDEPACIVTACKDGYKKCGARCVSLDDPKYGCGPTSCDDKACPDPGGGTLTCDAGKCVVGSCSATTKKCGNKCVPKNEDNGCSAQSCDACAANEVCTGDPSQCTCVPVGDACAGYECGTQTDSCGNQQTCTNTCHGTLPICIGNACKECKAASDCGVPQNNPCFKAVCNANSCGLVAAGASKSCSLSGTCSATEPGACSRPPVSIAGSGYNIDATEVTRAQYSAFLKAKAGNTNGQTTACNWNTSYTPDKGWPGAAELADNPVTNVDWCDADAYCKWAGRRLCGKIGGGPADTTVDHMGTSSEWVHACMPTPGAKYPYGDVFDQNACNTKSTSLASAPVASYSACVGGVAGLYDMVGNVAEWINSCEVQGGNDYCSTQGGAFDNADNGAGTTCASGNFYYRNVTADFIGFRCCGP